MPMVKLVYFAAEGRGELTRILLNIGNIDFEDFRFGFEDWPKHKPNTPFGSVPVLFWDGEELAQTMAIVKFVARKVGMAGKSDVEFAQADMVACQSEDCWAWWPKMRFCQNQADREKIVKEFFEEFIPKWLAPLEKILQKRGGEWYAGSGPTFADLAMMVHLNYLHYPDDAAFKNMNNVAQRRKLLDAFPLVKANYQRTLALPAVVAWNKKKPAFQGF